MKVKECTACITAIIITKKKIKHTTNYVNIYLGNKDKKTQTMLITNVLE